MPTPWKRVPSGDSLSALEKQLYLRLPDRAGAIRKALEAAAPGDAVVLAGKGHENTQNLGGVVSHFDDREEARKVLADWGAREHR